MGNGEDREGGHGEYASPACSMHEVDPAYMGLDLPPRTDIEVTAWRKGERARLIAARMALPADIRQQHSGAIAAGLDRLLPDVSGREISLYWPFRGEPDLRDWMERVTARGGTCLLPVVAGKGMPLSFRAWKAGDRLERGVWNIPYPAEGPDAVPDVVIAPLVGYDPAFYRLGYGGGFFDRTLAAMENKPRIIGVGYALQHIPTIHPQVHDIPMGAIVTELEAREVP